MIPSSVPLTSIGTSRSKGFANACFFFAIGIFIVFAHSGLSQFSLAMYGGARQSNYPDKYKDFVFPYLHSIRSDGVA
jgi:hypothetical protein